MIPDSSLIRLTLKYILEKSGFTLLALNMTEGKTEGRNSNGFTLIELLVVIAIIGVLMSLMAANLSSIQARSRDGQRKTDLRKVQKGLEQYKRDFGVYPDVSGANKWALLSTLSPILEPLYINPVPTDPRNAGCSGYLYSVSASGQRYVIFAKLENSTDFDVKTFKDEPSTHIVSDLHPSELTGICPGAVNNPAPCLGGRILTFQITAGTCNGSIYNYWVNQL